MKIFISYGHNDYTPLVDRLFDALIEAGHEPWKDDRYEGNSGIAAGQDFTEVIYEAIDAADFVIAFVTRNTQKKPYCRDERQHAYNKKGARFIQIRMDNVEITLGNAQSYIDMSDTVDSTGCIREKLFENSLKAIFAAFRDPVSFAEGGITPWAKIDTHLKVPGSLKYHDFIATLEKSDFVGREWLMEKCKVWAQDASISRRLFVIFGEAGTGKTAFIRRLSQDEALVRSVHVCIYDRPSTRTVRDTLKNLAYVLAHKCDSYYQFLKTENLEKIKEMSEDAMFEYLFLDALKTVEEKYLLIIDGLDELDEASGLKPLMRIFRQYADRINPNISFLVTTRPDETITDLLKTVGKGRALESVTLSKDANQEDLLRYISQKLEELDCAEPSLAQKILEACDGNFEYLSLLFKEAAEEGLKVSEDIPLPRGLNERYIQYLDRRMEMRDQSRLSRQQRQLLAMLCAAQEPIPLSLLADAADLDEYDVQDELDVFGSLIHQSDEKDPRIALFTKGFRDFLLSRDCRRYSADSDAGNDALAQYMLEHIRSEKDLLKQPYLSRNGFVHLLRYAQDAPEEVNEYLHRLYDTGVDVLKQITDALCINSEAILEGYFSLQLDPYSHSEIRNQLRKQHAAGPLAEFARQQYADGETSDALLLQIELLLWEPSPENTERAEQLYRKILEMHPQAESDSISYDDMYYLCAAYEGLGDLAVDKGVSHHQQAEAWYRKAWKLQEAFCQKHPDSNYRRGLSGVYHKLGDLAFAGGKKRDLSQALEWYLKAVRIDIDHYREYPCYNTGRPLSITYDGLSLILQERGREKDIQQAEKYILAALELNLLGHQENPCYESRRDLSIAYTRRIDFTVEHGKQYKPEQVMQWLTEAMKLDQQNYRENPCYESRRDLSIIYKKLASFTLEQSSIEDTQQVRQWLLTVLELAQQNYRENPCYESRRDLSGSYHQLLSYAAEHDADSDQTAQWLEKALALDQKNYLENPCYESRQDLSFSYFKQADFIAQEDPGQAMQLYLEVLALRTQNDRENPSYESKADLADIYGALADLNAESSDPEDREQARKHYLQALELHRNLYREKPCYDNRSDLAGSYKDLSFLVIKDGTQKDFLQARKWHLAALELDRQNYREKPDYENRRALIMDLNVIGGLFAKIKEPSAAAQEESYLRESAKLCEENHLAKPCQESRQDLARALIWLSDIAVRQGSPEDLSQGQQLLLRALELNTQNYEHSPGFSTKRSVSLVYDKLSNIAVKRGTDEDLKQALGWITKVVELDRQIYEEVPSSAHRRFLAIFCRRQGILVAQSDSPEDLSQAQESLKMSMKLLKEAHLESPSEKSRQDLTVSYALLAEIARQINTPEALAEAEKWDALRAQL